MIIALLSGTTANAAGVQPPPVPMAATPMTTAAVADDDEDAFNRQLVEDIARLANDPEVREAAQAALATNDPAVILDFLDYGEPAAKKRAAERKRLTTLANRETVKGWVENGGPNVRAGAKAAIDSGDDTRINDFVAFGKEIAEKQDAQAEIDSKAERERITGRVRAMVAQGGPQVKTEGAAALASGDYAQIEAFYKTGYAQANNRDHEYQKVIEKALDDRNKAIAELTAIAQRSADAAKARTTILRANIDAVQFLDNASQAMLRGRAAAQRADEILQEDKPLRANGHRGRNADIDALRAEATRQTESAAAAADFAASTTAQVQNAAANLIHTGMTNGVDWAKVTIAVGSATQAAAKATETAQHATEATLADSRALDADANAQEHADNARKWREEADRQAQIAADLAAAAKVQLQIAVQARDRARAQQAVAEDAARKARQHAANARTARINAQSAGINAINKGNAAISARNAAAKASTRESKAIADVKTTAASMEFTIPYWWAQIKVADTSEQTLRRARDEATKAGKNADEATKDIAEATKRARDNANAAGASAERARNAAAVARSEAAAASAEAQRARQAAAQADQEALTARRAADEANRLAMEAASAAAQSQADADHTRYEAEAAISESNQAVFQTYVADRAAYAASASSAMVVDPAKTATIIARSFAGINADARRAMDVAANALMIGDEQAKSAKDKAAEAGEAAQRARQAADTAVEEMKAAYEAAARAANSALQAAQDADSATEAARAAVQAAAGAHRAATNATQSASSARSDATLAGRAAMMATGAAEAAQRAAGEAEEIRDWANASTNSIHEFTTEIISMLKQVEDANAQRAEVARRQQQYEDSFKNALYRIWQCTVDTRACKIVGKFVEDVYNDVSAAIGDYFSNIIHCVQGQQAACDAWQLASAKIYLFQQNMEDGLFESAKNFGIGLFNLGYCGLGSPLDPGQRQACATIGNGLTNLYNHPFEVIHLTDWHENPGKALGMTLFDIATFAIPGGSGAVGKVAEAVSAALSRAVAKISNGFGRVGEFTAKVAEMVPGRFMGDTAQVVGLTIKIENGTVTLNRGVAALDGQLFRINEYVYNGQRNLANMEGWTAKIESATLSLDQGVGKLEVSGIKFEPPKGPEAPGLPTGTQHDGSWIGRQNGQELGLDPSVNKRADDLLAAAEKNEKTISPKIERTIEDLREPAAKAEGWPYRLKGEDSLKRKIASEIADGQTADYAFGKVNDSVRYTITLPETQYTSLTQKAFDTLRSQDLEMTGFNNLWKKNETNGKYVGLNTTWRDPATGQIFEVQFHTEYSYWAKTIEHPIYEDIRVLNKETQEAEINALRETSRLIFGNVPSPPGAIEITRPF
ncbi:hypothetical protein [Amycolatopsis sp. NPDC059657]|uniref:ALF repeat-containing protein n=1 Tax=Amycolatopsis sp. NPDC059657 TaxID=3346899 RepID=UPI00366F1A1D